MTPATPFKVDNRVIAKNTLFLYFRMLVLMLVSLYTSRVILQSLGVVDYGIYNVVGGLVALSAILREATRTSIMRYLTCEIGDSGNHLGAIFSTSIIIQLVMSIVIVLIAETIGVWFLLNKMVIPDDRLFAAQCCFHLSLVSFILRLLSIPYDAVIIAHERMSAFAYISILDGLGQLVIAWVIDYNPIDRLVFFSFLSCVLSIFIRGVYLLYCRRYFYESRCFMGFDKKIFKNMCFFTGWNVVGSASYQLMTEGVNLLVNIFFGVTVNAARAIASQVSGAVSVFVGNFTNAINPQIMKSYATGQKEDLFSLIFRGAKFSFFLMLLFAVPLFCETRSILGIWLVSVPEHSVSFVQLSIIVSLLGILSNSMETAAVATGRLRKYQIFVGGSGLLVLPLAWFLLWFGYPPEITYVTTIVVGVIQFVIRIYIVAELIGMSIKSFISEVVVRVFITSVVAFLVPLYLHSYMEESLYGFWIVVFCSILFTLLSIRFFGVTTSEWRTIYGELYRRLEKLKK